MREKILVNSPKLKRILKRIAKKIIERRQQLAVTAVATAEAAGISRITLNRIENGEPSVSMGSYLKVMGALGLEPTIEDKMPQTPTKPLAMIHLKDYPQLKKLGWQLDEKLELTPTEAFNLYEKNWRHLDLTNMKKAERLLILQLMNHFDTERLLV